MTTLALVTARCPGRKASEAASPAAEVFTARAVTAPTMQRICPPNYTQIPNSLLDSMAELSDAELRVMLFICRQTFGWQRDRVAMSIGFIEKGTGMSRQGVLNAVTSTVERGLVEKVAGKNNRACNTFRLLVNAVDQSTPLTTNSQRRGLEVVNAVDPKKEREIKEIKEAAPEAPATSTASKKPKKETDPRVTELTEKWCEAFESRFGRRYMHGGAKDGVAVKKLLTVGMPVDDLVATFKDAWQKTNPKTHWYCVNQSRDLCKFAAAFNSIMGELAKDENGNLPKPPVDWDEQDRQAREDGFSTATTPLEPETATR